MFRPFLFLISFSCSTFCYALPPVGVGDDELAHRIEVNDWGYVRQYVETGGDLSWTGFFGISLLDHVVARGQHDLAVTLIEKGALARIKTQDDFESLFQSVIVGNDFILAAALLETLDRFPFEPSDSLLNGLLDIAVGKESYRFVDFFVERGADLNYLYYGEYTILMRALGTFEQNNMYDYLIGIGARVDVAPIASTHLLITAIQIEKFNVVRQLLAGKIDPNLPTDDGFTALMAAVANIKNSDAVVPLLLESGAQPCLTDSQGMTAYDHGVVAGKHELLARFPQLSCATPPKQKQ